jgi:hypothetical protein
MDQQLLDAVIERAGISEEEAEDAIRAMVEVIENRLPAGIAAHVLRVADFDDDGGFDDDAGSTTQKFSAVTEGMLAAEE